MQRREFLTAVAAATAVGSAAAAGSIPRRPYKDGIELSVIGFGGIVVVGQDQPAADRTVAAAFERGVNYYDVAPSYWEGEAEIKYLHDNIYIGGYGARSEPRAYAWMEEQFDMRVVQVEDAVRVPGGDRAEPAASGARVPHEHDRGGAPAPALPHVRTVGLLAHGVEVEGAEELLEADVVLPRGRADPEPLRLAGLEHLG